ncbi:MAG: glycosyltransferase family 4 protein, partial [Anaerolineae bacterium]
MRILQIVSGRGTNGAVQHCLWLIRELLARGHQVTLLCRPGAWIAVQLTDAGLEAILESSLERWPPADLRRIAAELKRYGIQVIHSHMSDAHAFGVLLRLLTGIPSVATAHNTHIQLHWAFNDRVIAVSEAVRRFHCRYNLVADRRIVTIHNFLDRQRLAEIDRALLERSHYHFAPGLLFGYVGTVEPRKGLIHLVEAMAQVPHGRLLVAGSTGINSAYFKRVQRRAQRLGVAQRIDWLGHRQDVPAILSLLDVLVVPSLREAFSLVLLEAKASGLPVVATRSGGPEELIQDGEDGVLVEQANPAALAMVLNELVVDADRRNALGICAA